VKEIKRYTLEIPIEIFEKMDEMRRETKIPLKYLLLEGFKEYYRRWKISQRRKEKIDKEIEVEWEEN